MQHLSNWRLQFYSSTGFVALVSADIGCWCILYKFYTFPDAYLMNCRKNKWRACLKPCTTKPVNFTLHVTILQNMLFVF